MNNRLAIQDLAGLLAEYTGKDKNSSERFFERIHSGRVGRCLYG